MLALNTTDMLIGALRPLSVEDVETIKLLCGGGPGLAGSLKIKHHRVAHLAASGLGPMEIAEAMALDPGTVLTLLRSNAMQGLIQQYQQDGAQDAVALQNRARAAAFAGVAEVHRLLENPQGLEFKDLVQATQMLMDRTGVGPTSKHQVMSASLTREELLGIAGGAGDRVIDVELVDGKASVPAVAGADPGATGGASVRAEAREDAAAGSAGEAVSQPVVH